MSKTIRRNFKIGDKVKIHPDNDNENYDKYRNRTLTVTHIAWDKEQHPGYDDGLKGHPLLDFKVWMEEQNEVIDLPFSLYDYEVKALHGEKP